MKQAGIALVMGSTSAWGVIPSESGDAKPTDGD